MVFEALKSRSRIHAIFKFSKFGLNPGGTSLQVSTIGLALKSLFNLLIAPPEQAESEKHSVLITATRHVIVVLWIAKG